MTESSFRFTGPIAALMSDERDVLFARNTSRDNALRRRTARLLNQVRVDGDAALFAMARELDRVELSSLEIPCWQWQAALEAIAPSLRRSMERSAANIATAHRAWLPRIVEVETEPGVLVGRRPDPLARIGVYAPGGSAAYPSSVLMGAVPARVAGVGEIILCSPPNLDGLPSPIVLAAAALVGVDRVFAIGGAGAIGALAFGTASVPRVDRIVGPGNAYVAEAKRQVSGVVAIDSPAGPSELFIIADQSARATVVAREAVAQAEHDRRAAVIIVVLGGETMARRIEAAVLEVLPAQERRAIITESLATRGGLLTARSLEEAIAFASEYAPEHLMLAIHDPETVLAKVGNAGTVFLGESSSVTFGDYLTGANHVLPTGGFARSYSGLSTLDFVRWTTYQRVAPAAAACLAADTAHLAEAEGLLAHAAAARSWQKNSDDERRTERATHELARASYRRITRYAPDRAPCAIDLSDNTNLWGPPPSAVEALRVAAPAAVRSYPSPYAEELKAAAAAYLALDAAQIVTGCGSDEVLDAAIRAFGEPGDRIVYAEPSFEMLPVLARLNGLEPVAVPLTADFDADVEALLAADARILYLCSPNNPTGTALSRSAIEWIVARAPGLVILDEAYVEFAGRSAVDLLSRSPRLLITRTMSKAFGLAGLRIGYAAGAPDLVAEVEKSRGPYKVNGLAERAALAALTTDLPWVRARVAEMTVLRGRLVSALEDLGLRALPSSANFVLVPMPDAVVVAARMRAAGVAVRPFRALPGVGDALRISVGPWPMLATCLQALSEALQ